MTGSALNLKITLITNPYAMNMMERLFLLKEHSRFFNCTHIDPVLDFCYYISVSLVLPACYCNCHFFILSC